MTTPNESTAPPWMAEALSHAGMFMVYDDDDNGIPNNDANANLITAAPYLLSACIAVAQATEGMYRALQSHHLPCYAAIAKARGTE